MQATARPFIKTPHQAGGSFISWLVLFWSWGIGTPGDEVFLKNGNRLSGDVEKLGEDRIRVILDVDSNIEISLDDVSRIVPGRSPLRDYESRRKTLDADDVDGLYQLALWAKKQGLNARCRLTLQEIIAIDPNHLEARRDLGYVVFKNRWLEAKILRDTDQLVLYEGEWMRPEERDRKQLEKLRLEIRDDILGIDSDNEAIRRFSIRRLKERTEALIVVVLGEFLGHEQESIRASALQLLAFHWQRLLLERDRKDGKAGKDGKTEAAAQKTPSAQAAKESPGILKSAERSVAAALLERTLRENSPLVRKSLYLALARMGLRAYFDAALALVKTAAESSARRQAAEGILYALRKAWMPELIAALQPAPSGASSGGNEEVREILKRILKQDFGFAAEDWLKWWRVNQDRYYDDE